MQRGLKKHRLERGQRGCARGAASIGARETVQESSQARGEVGSGFHFISDFAAGRGGNYGHCEVLSPQ